VEGGEGVVARAGERQDDERVGDRAGLAEGLGLGAVVARGLPRRFGVAGGRLGAGDVQPPGEERAAGAVTEREQAFELARLGERPA
jgi:hypothetical protein